MRTGSSSSALRSLAPWRLCANLLFRRVIFTQRRKDAKENRKVRNYSIALTIVLAVFVLAVSACGTSSKGSAAQASSRLTEDEKHRLYSAALASSDSPLETDTFKQVCHQIGIFDANGKPNDQYMAFVSRHVDWSIKSESDQFRVEINSKEKAREYVKRHLSQ